MVIKIDTTPDPRADERIDVFEIDGAMYSMPAVIPGNVSLEVLDRIRKYGQEAAISWALEAVMGGEAYHALRTCKTLRTADLRAVMDVVGSHVMGAVEEPGKG